jgi:hypothetical protein
LNRVSTLGRIAGAAVLLLLLVPSALAIPAQQLQISVNATSPVFAGQTVQITATVQLNNGSAIGTRVSFTYAKIFYPNGTAVALPAPTVVASQLVEWTWTLPAKAPDGLYTVTLYAALAGTNSSWGTTSFTVNSQIASKTGLTGITTQLTGISSQLSAISKDMEGNFSAVLTALSTDYSALSSSVSTLAPKLGALAVNMKANFTTVTSALSSDYGSLSTSVSSGFKSIGTSISGLSGDIGGNFTLLASSVQAVKNDLNSLASSVSISGLNSTVIAGFGSINSALSTLASSSQANSLQSSIQQLGNQATLISNIQTYLLVPVALAALILLVFLILRKRKP